MATPIKVKPKDDMMTSAINGIVDQDVKNLSYDEDLDHKFATETSLHGIGFIASAKNLLIKAAWTVVVVSMTALLIWQIALLLIHYFKYEPVTEVRIEVRCLKIIIIKMHFPPHLTVRNY